MAMISDTEYILQAIRLSALRVSDDPLTPRIISLDPGFSLNPYINASGLSDTDRWPEIKRALDSPPPDYGYSSAEDGLSRYGRNGNRERTEGKGGLKYTQTIMGGKSGAVGMRVSGRSSHGETSTTGGRRAAIRQQRTNSVSSVGPRSPRSSTDYKTPTHPRVPPTMDNGFFSPSGRPRADSAPMPNVLSTAPSVGGSSTLAGTSAITTGRGMGLHAGTLSGIDSAGSGLLELALSVSGVSGSAGDDDEEDEGRAESQQGIGIYYGDGSSVGESARPSETDGPGALVEEIVDEGSDVEDEEDAEDESGVIRDRRSRRMLGDRKFPVVSEDERRSSDDATPPEPADLDFTPIVIQTQRQGPSALTLSLNQRIPHLVSTAPASSLAVKTSSTTPNPFASLYASVQAPPTVPSVLLELFFPHSKEPTKGMAAKVRKDATVEEVIGFGLYKFWEEGREPKLSKETSEEKLSAVGWGLRMVEDDGEVDEDFPPLDRESQISKFSYGQFAIVEATESQVRQNIVKAPMIQRRPSRIIAIPQNAKPSTRGRPNLPPNSQSGVSGSFSIPEQLPSTTMNNSPLMGGSTLKSGVGLSSAMSKPLLLRVRVSASADVHFTTTISVPSDMYIADLTEVLVKKKRLQNPASDWVLCLADLTLALPLDRTVASLEGKHDLALVRRQWATEHGLNTGDRRGGDPSASIFKRASEPAPYMKYGAGLADLSQAYKKYTVQRKIAIGRHERVLAIDGDYIHIMPSDNKAFFDSMKTTSFHITLVASCKLTGRGGGFKINVWREGGQKRYEFEAENGKQAAEIITSIRNLMKMYQSERSSMLPPPRPATGRR